jgi:hypothetical protein
MTTVNQETEKQNPNAPWYRVKYLGLTCTVAFMWALIDLWRWPPDRGFTREGLVFLGIAVLCIVVSKYKLLVLIMPLGIIGFRAAVAAILGIHPAEALTIAVLAGSLCFILVKSTAQKYKNFTIPDGYPLREMGMDVLIMGPILFALYLVHKFV